MTKELYPRPRAKIGDIVVYRYEYGDGSVKYFQARIDQAHGTRNWIYGEDGSSHDFSDSDVLANLTTGSKLVDGEWVDGVSATIPVWKTITSAAPENTLAKVPPSKLTGYRPSIDEFGLHIF